MFFDDIFVKNKALGQVWRAGNIQSESFEEKTSLPIICENLEGWVKSDSMDAKKRLSLRTSAVLIDGATKIYKKQLQELIEYGAELDKDIVMRNRINSNSFANDSSSTPSSSPCETPEQMMRQAVGHAEISFESHTRKPTQSPTPEKVHSHRSFSKSSHSNQSAKRKSNETIDSYEEPKRRITNQDLSKELTNTTEYPSSQYTVDISDQKTSEDHSNTSFKRKTNDDLSDTDKSLILKTNYVRSGTRKTKDGLSEADKSSNGKRNDGLSETDKLSNRKTNDSRSESNKSDQRTNKINPAQSAASADSSCKPQSAKPKSSHETSQHIIDQTGKISECSPTFTELFDIVASLPNNDNSINIDTRMIAIGRQSDDIHTFDIATNSNIKNTNNVNIDLPSVDNTNDPRMIATGKQSNDVFDIYRKSIPVEGNNDKTVPGDRNSGDGRAPTSMPSDDNSFGPQRDIILKSARKSQTPKVRRNKKISKSRVEVKDQASQTSDEDIPFDKNLPFGTLLIYNSYKDSFETGIISKIVMSSLKDVNFEI